MKRRHWPLWSLLLALVLSFAAPRPALATAPSNETVIYNYLKGTMGLNTAASCGVLSNIYSESGFDPHATGDGGTSYGICQWHNSRWDNLKTYCSQNGYDWTTLIGQLHFLDHELRNSYGGVWSHLNGVADTADGAYDAGYYWCYHFEVPANKESVSVTRGNRAKDTYWPKYQNDVNRDPVGAFTSCTGGDLNRLRIQGWAYDPDVPNDAIAIHVYVGGPAGVGTRYTKDAAGNTLYANQQFRSQGKSDFDYTLKINEAGALQIYVYAINNVANTANPMLEGSGVKAIVCTGSHSGSVTSLPAGRYAIRSKSHPERGLDVQGASTDNKTDIILHTWTAGRMHQLFDVTINSDSTYKISPAHSGGAVEVTDAICSNGANVAQYVDNGSLPQRWWAYSNSDGTWSFTNRVSGLALGFDSSTWSIKTYTRSAGSAAQSWYLVPNDASAWDIAVPQTSSDPTPKPTVTAGGIELVEGVDYTVSYENNDQGGTATVVVTAGNGYTGSKSVTFTYESYAQDGWVDLPGGKGYAKNGALVKGWLDLDSAKYYFGDDNVMYVGWHDVVIDGKTMHYYFRPSGNLARGAWADIDGVKYYFRPSGNMATGWADIDGKKYYFDEQGQMVTGWYDVVNANGVSNHYYFRPSGSMATGWAEIDGAYFYFRPSGNMATGFTDVTDDAYKRYFDSEGRMLTGWQEINGNTYYFRASGAMQTGEATIDGMVLTFTDKGVLVNDSTSQEAANDVLRRGEAEPRADDEQAVEPADEEQGEPGALQEEYGEDATEQDDVAETPVGDDPAQGDVEAEGTEGETDPVGEGDGTEAEGQDKAA